LFSKNNRTCHFYDLWLIINRTIEQMFGGVIVRPYTIREAVARAKAKQLLREYSISHPPVCPEDLAERLNIKICYHWVDDVDFSFSLKKKGKYFICIHPTGNQGRDTWSIAHELGHIVLGHYELYPVDTITIDRLNDSERYILDREADIFSEELLMPAEWIIQHKDANLKELFNVSEKAISIRLEKLSCLL